MDGYNHYIRVDTNNFVIYAFSDAFEQPQTGDILVSSNADRHFNSILTDSNGNPAYKWDGTQMVSRTNDADYLLTVAKQNKLAECESKYEQATAMVQSSALGTVHTYVIRSGDTDYSKFFNAKFSFVQTSYYDGSSFNWYTIEAGDVLHTKEQFCQAWTDIEKYTETARGKRKDYQSQINACATAADVNAINITY